MSRKEVEFVQGGWGIGRQTKRSNLLGLVVVVNVLGGPQIFIAPFPSLASLSVSRYRR